MKPVEKHMSVSDVATSSSETRPSESTSKHGLVAGNPTFNDVLITKIYCHPKL